MRVSAVHYAPKLAASLHEIPRGNDEPPRVRVSSVDFGVCMDKEPPEQYKASDGCSRADQGDYSGNCFTHEVGAALMHQPTLSTGAFRGRQWRIGPISASGPRLLVCHVCFHGEFQRITGHGTHVRKRRERPNFRPSDCKSSRWRSLLHRSASPRDDAAHARRALPAGGAPSPNRKRSTRHARSSPRGAYTPNLTYYLESKFCVINSLISNVRTNSLAFVGPSCWRNVGRSCRIFLS